MRDPHRRLSRSVQEFLTSVGVPERGHLDDLPKRWEKFSDVALLQRSAFTHTRWDGLGQAGLWEAVAEGLSVSRLGRKGEVSGDFRESNAELLLGEDDVVERIENGCRFEYPFCSIMWSQGNFSERVRVTTLVERGDVVADLFSGQGYFTIPILVHTEAAHVHAFEWDPRGILALDRNLEINSVSERCTIHVGDSREAGADSIPGGADRVLLGLLPSSHGGYAAALRVLKREGGTLHVHGLGGNQESWANQVEDALRAIEPGVLLERLAITKGVSKAPRWEHLVLDVRVSRA